MKYLIEYDGYKTETFKAKGIKDCITQFAEYTGCYQPLFIKALQGCVTADDYCQMFNHFSNYTIDAIHIVEETIYRRENNDEKE